MRLLSLFTLALILMLSGCGQAPAPPAASTPSSQAPGGTSAYPSPQGAYPAPAGQETAAYPGPSSPPAHQGPQFTINGPVQATDTTLSGTGGPGVPIRLVNLTRGGETITETTVGSDGTFTVDIGGKISSRDTLGIMLGSTNGTQYSPSDFISGPGYEDLPLIGVVFAKVVVD